MRLEDYFDFLAPVDIRIKGTRLGIETILLAYLDEKLTAEQIAERYPNLSLEQVYATILYYLHNREQADSYLDEYLAESLRRQEAQDCNPPSAVRRLQQLRARRDAFPPEERAEAWKRLVAEEKAQHAAGENRA